MKELAGRAGARLLSALSVFLPRHTALWALLRLVLPARAVPRVLGVDEFALRRGNRYATILINVETHERVDVLPDRKADTFEAWLRTHPGVEVVCRDGSGAYAEAIRRALPEATQVGDRWHLWNNLAKAVAHEVAAHSTCWARTGPPPADGVRAATTRQRWHQVHTLLDKGVGLLECARRLNLGLNTVKRYARVPEPDRLIHAPQYRPTLADPYRNHLRTRREQEPAVPVTRLFDEIRTLGYTGSFNLLYRYITQGRIESDHPTPSPKRVTRLLLTHPDHLLDDHRELLDKLTSACPQMNALADLVHSFAALLTPAQNNIYDLTASITQAREEDLPHLHAYTRGLEQDHDPVTTALTLPHHNGTTEGINNKPKLLKRQMYGRAGFALLTHRILLG